MCLCVNMWLYCCDFFFFSSRRRHTRSKRDWSSDVCSSDLTAEVRERRRAVQAALAELPPEQREALELAYYGGLTQSELAERLAVPLGTVKSRMFAALTKLRELLEEPV